MFSKIRGTVVDLQVGEQPYMLSITYPNEDKDPDNIELSEIISLAQRGDEVGLGLLTASIEAGIFGPENWTIPIIRACSFVDEALKITSKITDLKEAPLHTQRSLEELDYKTRKLKTKLNSILKANSKEEDNEHQENGILPYNR